MTEKLSKRRDLLRWRQNRLRRLDCIKDMSPLQAERASQLANQIQIMLAINLRKGLLNEKEKYI